MTMIVGLAYLAGFVSALAAMLVVVAAFGVYAIATGRIQ